MIRTLALGTALPVGPWTSPSRDAPPDSDWAAALVAPGPAARNPTRRRGKYRRIEDLQGPTCRLRVLGEERPRRGPLGLTPSFRGRSSPRSGRDCTAADLP